MKKKITSLFFVAISLVGGCASAGLFPYRYYNADIPSRVITLSDVGKSLSDLVYSEGVLYGRQKDPGDGNGIWPDRPFSDCQPDPVPSPSSTIVPNRNKCTIFTTPDAYQIKAKLEDCQVALDECQHPHDNPQPLPSSL